MEEAVFLRTLNAASLHVGYARMARAFATKRDDPKEKA